MKVASDQGNDPVITQPKRQTPPTVFSTTLTDGREITIREMTGRDLIYMEKDLGKLGDIEKAMKIIERLVVGTNKITYDEVLDLGVRDYRRLSKLVSQASDTEEDEDPN